MSLKTLKNKPFVSDKLAKRRKAATRARRIVGFILIALILGGAIYFTHANRYLIKDVTVVGTKAVLPEEVKTKVETSINSSRFFILPKRNIFLYPRNNLKEMLARDFPRLNDIDVHIENKNLVVTVTEREPAYLWCGQTIPTTRATAFAGTCYFVDETGFIFSQAPQFSDAVYPKIYTTLSNGEQSIGQFAMDKEVIVRVATFAREITNAMFKPSAFSVTSEGDVLLLLYRDSDVAPEVRYNPTHDPISDAVGFNTAVTSEPLKSKLAKSFAVLEYIDVRFPNKVFYKFHDEQPEQNKPAIVQ